MKLDEHFPVLHSEKFLLRSISDHDTSEIFLGLSHPDVIRYYGVSYESLPATYEQVAFYDHLFSQKKGIWWGICYPFHSSKMIGACGFSAWNPENKSVEIGYWLLPAWWRLGVMTECVGMIMSYAFNFMGIEQIEAQIEPENTASIALAQRLGFSQTDILQDQIMKNGSKVDLLVFVKHRDK